MLHPCSQVMALVKSTKKSVLTQMGDGHRLVTEGVQDFLFPGEPVTLVPYCTLENLAEFKLDPPRGRDQFELELAMKIN